MKFQRTTAINKILALKKRKKVIQGGTSAGKTYGVIPVLINIAQNKKIDITIASVDLPHLKRGARKDFLDIMKATQRFDRNHWHATDNIYTFSNGSRIDFLGCDDEKKVRGGRRDVLYINEANLMKWETSNQLMIRTREDIYLDFNPTEEFWAHTEVLAGKDAQHLILTYKDNEACPPETIKDLEAAIEKAKTDKWWENWVNVYVYGLIGQFEGAAFGSFNRFPSNKKLDDAVKVALIDPNLTAESDNGSDLLCVPIAYIIDKKVYIKDVICNENYTDQEFDRIADLLKEHKVSRCFIETNGIGSYFKRKLMEKTSTEIFGYHTRGEKYAKIANNSFWCTKNMQMLDSGDQSPEYKLFYDSILKFDKNPKKNKQRGIKRDPADAIAMLAEKIRNYYIDDVEV